MDLTQQTIPTIREALRSQQISAAALVRAYLDRIEQLDPDLHVYNETYAERAAERAQAVDDGRITGPLAGVPIALKDNMCTTWGRTTVRVEDSRRLPRPLQRHGQSERLEAAGAIILGKTNIDEFAMGSSTENSATHPTRNPWHTDLRARRFVRRQCRGDGGRLGGRRRSVRTPADPSGSRPRCAAWSVSSRPTDGVSRFGLVAFASSLDQIGPFAHTVADCCAAVEHHRRSRSARFDQRTSESVSGPHPRLRRGIRRPRSTDFEDRHRAGSTWAKATAPEVQAMPWTRRHRPVYRDMRRGDRRSRPAAHRIRHPDLLHRGHR
jgi:aspartyl-tRNA(Asn)/glutamyl-tRNA(Gln) amidotransferase subunit A